jgi:hypothetical protein
MNLSGSNSNSQKRRKKGFALILTLALISFVFLLVITLVNQVRVEFTFTESRQNQILAKAHARMGMMIAIGEIQKHLGPDTRVSATADIYDERLSFSENSSSVDLNEDGMVNTIPLGQRMWTGVWKNRGGWAETKLATRPLPENRDDGKALTLSWSYDSSYDPHPAVESAWLVSGNEGWKKKLAILSSNNVVREFVEVPDGIIIDDEGARVLNQPRGDTYGQAENPWADHKLIVEDVNRSNAYYHPLLSVADDEQKAWLLKYPVLGEDFDPQNPAHQNNWEQYLVGEPVAVPKTAIHDADDTDSGLAENQSQDWGERKGSYAYWVADEGVKAKINISVPELTNETKLKVASSPNIGEGSFGINLTPQKEDKRKDLLTIDSLSSLLDVDQILLKSNSYHSMTADSFGVLTDVRTGGLKRDLSLVFSLDQDNSQSWRKDFESNFIFRDRVRALKNIPLEPDSKRNQWYVSANDATIDDPNALLAGPPWSVLADYHSIKLSVKRASQEDVDSGLAEFVLQPIETLMMQSPSQFPRTVGDNFLIFGRHGPNGPRKVFNSVDEAYNYYNCFSSSVRKIRPEPDNHSILPVLVKARFSLCPVATNDSDNFCLSVSPSVTLWNPYNENLTIKDLFVEIPFANESAQSEPIELKVTQVNLREYDLYRKWWAYIYGDFNASLELKDSDLSNLGRPYFSEYIKNWKEPWGLYNFQSGFNSLNDPKTEQGLIDYFLKEQKLPPFDKEINPQIWSLRQPPDSMYGIKMEGNRFFHENPNLEIDGLDWSFTFHSLLDPISGEAKPFNIKIKDLYLKILNQDLDSSLVTLGPGEIVTFAAYSPYAASDFQTNRPLSITDDNVFPKIITLTKKFPESVEKGYIWDSGFPLNTDGLGYLIKMGGIQGYSSKTAEKFNWNGEREGSPDKGFIQPKCFTLWEGEPYKEDSIVITRYTEPRTAKLDLGTSVKFSTKEYLTWNFENMAEGEFKKNLFGLGWEVGLAMPGELEIERIPLVEFNPRALVHGTQHGRGSWLKQAKELKPDHYINPPRLEIKPFPPAIPFFIKGESLAFNSTSGSYFPKFPKSTPDFYGLPNSPIEDKLESTFYDSPDPDARASSIGFELKSVNFEIESDDNPDKTNTPKVSSSHGQERIGFFISSTETNKNPYNERFAESTHAVLFDVPNERILSLLEYRHANLNNYLHGPSYALGNSYATTQVARHRSWGRVQGIEKRPTSEAGLTNVANNMKKEVDAINFFKNLFGSDIAALKGLTNFIDWNIDPDGGFAPWRGWGFDLLNHQNTTVDHSYYLNRSLLDGYFLTGSTNLNDLSDESLLHKGKRFSPFLWEKGEQTKATLEGNARLVAFHRPARSNQDKTFWYDNLTKYESQTGNYSYQSIAGDLLLNGAFNVNSTSVDAWIAQISSLIGHSVGNVNITSAETPIPRLKKEPLTPVSKISSEPHFNNWNKLRTLSHSEIQNLAQAIVEQVKLRGPFLSLSDFVNRRLTLGPMDSDTSKSKGTRVNFVQYDLDEWKRYPEDRYTVQGLRGAMQSAVIESGINDPYTIEDGQFITRLKEDSRKIIYDSDGDVSLFGWIPNKDKLLPFIPSNRFTLENLNDSIFGLHASSKSKELLPNSSLTRSWGVGSTTQLKQVTVGDIDGDGSIDSIRDDLVSYPNTNFGEAPENLLAVEHLATGANKPGWVMQSDLLSPLIPVTSARSDTFVIRVQGDTNSRSPANAWIELVVQRTPDYVKPDLDAPHNRPHEPFKDINLNGFWDNGRGEHWIDLNQNADVFDQPDLPGVGELGKQKDYRDGLLSDLKLNMDPQEEDIESQSQISYLGTNQRFGRKFKIVRFRWLRANEV